MIFTTYNSESMLLLSDAPHWKRGFTSDFDFPTDTQISPTQRETRRSYGSTLRTTIQTSVMLSGASLLAAQGALRTLKVQPVLMPFWPAVSFWSARAAMKISGGLLLVYKSDWSQHEVYATTDTEPVWPVAGDLIVPVLKGYIDRDEIKFFNTDIATIPINFTEASESAFALTFVTPAFTDGPTPSGYASAPKLLPIAPDYKNIQETLTVNIDRETLGFSRLNRTTFYPHEIYRGQTARYTLSGATNIATFLGWYDSLASEGASFWAQSGLSVGKAGVAAVSGATAILFRDASALRDGDYICTTIGGVFLYRQVITIVDNLVAISTAFGVAIPAGTVFFKLSLSRLERTSISIRWISPVLIAVELNVSEVKPEEIVPSDETIGTTLGHLPTRCYLYEFTRTLGGALFTTYYTSYEKSLTNSGHTYVSQVIGHDAIGQSLTLDNDQTTVDVDALIGGPLLEAATLSMEAPLFVRILMADVSGATAINTAVVFIGELVNANVKGSKISAKMVTAGTIFDRNVPRVRFQKMCNNALYDIGCALAKADWKFSALISNPGTAGYPFTFVLGTIAGVGTDAIAQLANVDANWFAGGWIEFGSGATWCMRPILLSTTIAATVMTVTIDRDPKVFPIIGDAIVLYPGCDNSPATCKAKFDNYLNFLGHPFMPASNPSFIKKAQNSGGGKK